MVEPVRHRQTKGRQQICSAYSHCATLRLYQIGPLGQAHADGEDARIAAFFIPVPIPLLSDNRATVGGARRAAATADIGFGL